MFGIVGILPFCAVVSQELCRSSSEGVVDGSLPSCEACQPGDDVDVKLAEIADQADHKV